MRITVDIDRCIGAGQCVLCAPNVFDQTDEGLVEVLIPEPDPTAGTAVRQASQHCPSGAIEVLEDRPR
jgi:ferredoxin